MATKRPRPIDTAEIAKFFQPPHKKPTSYKTGRKQFSLPNKSTLEEEIDICISRNAPEGEKGAFLGKGEQGTAYAFGDERVIKQTNFSTKRKEQEKQIAAWKSEADIGTDLGKQGLAPKIFHQFLCKNIGFIVMSRLTTIPKVSVSIRQVEYTEQNLKKIITKELENHDHVRTVLKNNEGDVLENIDNLGNLTSIEQEGFIHALEKMIESGYVHMDNHIDNLGWNGPRENGHEIVFDFGFTQKRDFSNEIDRRWALCFSLFQIIENCPLDLLESTLIYRAATALLNGTYVWGNAKTGDIIPLKGMRPFLEPLTRMKPPFTYERLSEFSSDLELGSFAYANIIGLDLWERISAENENYNTIYEIRNPALRQSAVKK